MKAIVYWVPQTDDSINLRYSPEENTYHLFYPTGNTQIVDRYEDGVYKVVREEEMIDLCKFVNGTTRAYEQIKHAMTYQKQKYVGVIDVLDVPNCRNYFFRAEDIQYVLLPEFKLIDWKHIQYPLVNNSEELWEKTRMRGRFGLKVDKCHANWQFIEDVDCNDNDCVFSFLFDDGYRKLNSYRVFRTFIKARSWKDHGRLRKAYERKLPNHIDTVRTIHKNEPDQDGCYQCVISDIGVPDKKNIIYDALAIQKALMEFNIHR